MNSYVIHLNNEDSLKKFACFFADYLIKGDYVYLNGELGAGKTYFARFVIQQLMDNNQLEVSSPTFSLVNYYDWDNLQIIHADLYRIEDSNEIFELGLENNLADSIYFIEWSQRAQHLLPKASIILNFIYHEHGRLLEITATPDRLQQLERQNFVTELEYFIRHN